MPIKRPAFLMINLLPHPGKVPVRKDALPFGLKNELALPGRPFLDRLPKKAVIRNKPVCGLIKSDHQLVCNSFVFSRKMPLSVSSWSIVSKCFLIYGLDMAENVWPG